MACHSIYFCRVIVLSAFIFNLRISLQLIVASHIFHAIACRSCYFLVKYMSIAYPLMKIFTYRALPCIKIVDLISLQQFFRTSPNTLAHFLPVFHHASCHSQFIIIWPLTISFLTFSRQPSKPAKSSAKKKSSIFAPPESPPALSLTSPRIPHVKKIIISKSMVSSSSPSSSLRAHPASTASLEVLAAAAAFSAAASADPPYTPPPFSLTPSYASVSYIPTPDPLRIPPSAYTPLSPMLPPFYTTQHYQEIPEDWWPSTDPAK